MPEAALSLTRSTNHSKHEQIGAQLSTQIE